MVHGLPYPRQEKKLCGNHTPKKYMTAQHFFVMYINHAQRRTKNNLQKVLTDMPDKTSLVRSYFDAIANRYDLMNTLLSFGLHHAWKNRALREAAVNGDMHVLDVCGGTGDLAALASRKLNNGAAVTLYDFSLEMMLAGRRRANRRRQPTQYICGDAQFLALKDQHFDVVLIGFGLRNIEDMNAGLLEFQRVLKPGGRLVCLEFSQPVTPLLRRIYDIYSYRVIPVLGSLITGSREAYTYLPDSIRQFPSPKHLSQLIEQAGFENVNYRLLTGGIAAIHTGYKK
jgi:demethylmenaquinone methyltransferase/2-methoxy-6-polyprenyl-1,4-benzoquinol methylase